MSSAASRRSLDFPRFLDQVADSMRVNGMPEMTVWRFIRHYQSALKTAWRSDPQSGYRQGVALYQIWLGRRHRSESVENPISDKARMALLIGAVLMTGLGGVLIYEAIKSKQAPAAQNDQLPIFTPPITQWASYSPPGPVPASYQA